MKHIFIMNPVAGTRLARRMKRQIAKTCRRLRVDYHTHYTRSADDAPQYVRKLLDTHPEETYRIYAVLGRGRVRRLALRTNDNTVIYPLNFLIQTQFLNSHVIQIA